MAFVINFDNLTPEQTTQVVDISQKISAITGALAALADDRANKEAVWRKRENFLNTEKGKLEIQLRDLRKAIITGTE